MKYVDFRLQIQRPDDAPEYVIIDARLDDETSCGFITTESIDDIFTLRDHIDNLIYQFNLTPNMRTEDDENRQQPDAPEEVKPRFLPVIEGYINTQWQPTKVFNPTDRARFRVMTSQEIVIDLADMVDMELNDVAAAMIHLGYCTIIDDGKAGWALERRSK